MLSSYALKTATNIKQKTDREIDKYAMIVENFNSSILITETK